MIFPNTKNNTHWKVKREPWSLMVFTLMDSPSPYMLQLSLPGLVRPCSACLTSGSFPSTIQLTHDGLSPTHQCAYAANFLKPNPDSASLITHNGAASLIWPQVSFHAYLTSFVSHCIIIYMLFFFCLKLCQTFSLVIKILHKHCINSYFTLHYMAESWLCQTIPLLTNIKLAPTTALQKVLINMNLFSHF